MATPKKVQAAAPLAVSIPEAASMVGLGATAFTAQFIEPGLVQPVTMGRRRLIVVEELRRAFEQMVLVARAAQAGESAGA